MNEVLSEIVRDFDKLLIVSINSKSKLIYFTAQLEKAMHIIARMLFKHH